MKIYLDCYACFVRQALDAARRAGGDQKQQYAVIQKVLLLLQELPIAAQPPEIARRVHLVVQAEIGATDPYRDAKQTSTRQALALYPRLQELIARSDDPVATALRLSIAGNIIDLGVQDHYDDLWQTVERVLVQPLAIDNEQKLRECLDAVDGLLFLADNAGETVFDRVLIETLDIPVIYAVKGGPTLNDATVEDAVAAGIDQKAVIVSNGSQAPGTILSMCSAEFLQLFETSPLIVAKGQANYETLSDAGDKVFCLLQVKCPVIARDIDAPVGSIIIRQSL